MFTSRVKRFLPWAPFNGELERINRDFSRIFGRSSVCDGPTVPAFNIWADREGTVVTSELPGVKMEDLEITASGNVVTIKGMRKEETEEGGRRVRRERSFGEFQRTIELAYQIDAARVEAKLANGVLKLVLPRAEADKPRKIEVSAS